jgi:hypothetical protein
MKKVYKALHPIAILIDEPDTSPRAEDMSATASYNHTEVPIDDLPTALESTGSKLVYLYLDLTGDATIDELESTLGMRKLALYPVLDTLSAAGLVERDGEAFTAA